MMPMAGNEGGEDRTTFSGVGDGWAETRPFLPDPADDDVSATARHLPQLGDKLGRGAETSLHAKASAGVLAKAGVLIGGHWLLAGAGTLVATVALVSVGVVAFGDKSDKGHDAKVETAAGSDGSKSRTSTTRSGTSHVAPTGSKPGDSTTASSTTTTTVQTTTSRPGGVVPTAPPATTTTEPPPSTDPSPTEPAAPAPEIQRFDAQRGALCPGQRTQFTVGLAWLVRNATSGTVGPQGGTASAVDLGLGKTTVCAERGSVWVLTVTGAGGTTSRTATVP
jgi:hypothetical protein